jgi:hypothetical protein
MLLRLAPLERAEFLRGRAVSIAVDLPRRRSLSVSIASSLVGDWRCDSDPTGIWINVPRGACGEPLAPELVHEFVVDDGRALRLTVVFDDPAHEQGSS